MTANEETLVFGLLVRQKKHFHFYYFIFLHKFGQLLECLEGYLINCENILHIVQNR